MSHSKLPHYSMTVWDTSWPTGNNTRLELCGSLSWWQPNAKYLILFKSPKSVSNFVGSTFLDVSLHEGLVRRLSLFSGDWVLWTTHTVRRQLHVRLGPILPSTMWLIITSSSIWWIFQKPYWHLVIELCINHQFSITSSSAAEMTGVKWLLNDHQQKCAQHYCRLCRKSLPLIIQMCRLLDRIP